MNKLFNESLAAIPADVRREFEITHLLATRLDAALKEKGISQKELAAAMHKRESEVSRWLSGRHNFTLATIAKIETTLGIELIK